MRPGNKRFIEFEEDVLKTRLFWDEEPSLPKDAKLLDYWLMSRRFSVSKIAIAMADFSAILWLSLAVAESNLGQSDQPDWTAVVSYIVTLVLGVSLYHFAKSKPAAEH